MKTQSGQVITGDLPTPVEIWNKAKELNGVDFTTWYRTNVASSDTTKECKPCTFCKDDFCSKKKFKVSVNATWCNDYDVQ